jgi:hypothetical protein
MPKGRPKKIKEIPPEGSSDAPIILQVKTEKEELVELYEKLKARKIYSIGTLENLIANAR